MKLRVLTVLALAAALAACESDSANKGANDGAGMGGPGGISSGAVVPGTQSDLVANVGDRVFFDLDRYNVRPDARATLDRQAGWLKRYPQVSVVIEGHADERGTREYNLALGERRANSVRDYLVSQGVPASRVRVVSYGKERPVALGSNEAAWSQNRRGMTVVQ
jgi:peptidoglycan-associated lipoprotein